MQMINPNDLSLKKKNLGSLVLLFVRVYVKKYVSEDYNSTMTVGTTILGIFSSKDRLPLSLPGVFAIA